MQPHSNTPLRRCTNCGNEFPATTEYFYREKTCTLGLQTQCKACIVEKQRRREEANPEQHKENRRHTRQRHKDSIREYMRKWRKANRDKIAEQARQWVRKNRESVYARNREWQAANPGKVLANQRNMKARKRNAPGKHTAQDIQRQYNAQKGKCWWCKKKVGDTYHVDHVIPLSRGGSNNPENLVIACPSCNMSKHAKLPHEWIGRLL